MSSFDVFLSHNSKDKPVVRQLAEALQARGLNVWLDEWELVPGHPWQSALEEIIKTSNSAAVLIGKDGLGPWEEPEMRGCLDQFVKRKSPVIPVLLPDAPAEPRLPLFLSGFTWVDFRPDGITEATLDKLEWGITGRKPERVGGKHGRDVLYRIICDSPFGEPDWKLDGTEPDVAIINGPSHHPAVEFVSKGKKFSYTRILPSPIANARFVDFTMKVTTITQLHLLFRLQPSRGRRRIDRWLTIRVGDYAPAKIGRGQTEWVVHIPPQKLASSWEVVHIDIAKRWAETFGRDGGRIVSLLGIRVRGSMALASIAIRS